MEMVLPGDRDIPKDKVIPPNAGFVHQVVTSALTEPSSFVPDAVITTATDLQGYI